MQRHTNTYRRAGRDHAGRLDSLEAALLPESPAPPAAEYTRRMLDLMRWAAQAGGRASEIAAPLSALISEQPGIMCDALDAGEMELGDRFPRLLHARWVSTGDQEQRQRWEANVREIASILDELEAMRQQHAQQHGGAQ